MKKDAKAAAALEATEEISSSTESDEKAKATAVQKEKKAEAAKKKKKLKELVAKRKAEENEEEIRRKKKHEDSSGLSRSYAMKVKKGKIGRSGQGSRYVEPTLPGDVDVIVKSEKNIVKDWKKIKGEWYASAYINQTIPIYEDKDEIFRNWLSNKHPDFYECLMREAKGLSCIPIAPEVEVMDYKKTAEGKVDKIAFNATLKSALFKMTSMKKTELLQLRLDCMRCVPFQKKKEKTRLGDLLFRSVRNMFTFVLVTNYLSMKHFLF